MTCRESSPILVTAIEVGCSDATKLGSAVLYLKVMVHEAGPLGRLTRELEPAVGWGFAAGTAGSAAVAGGAACASVALRATLKTAQGRNLDIGEDIWG